MAKKNNKIKLVILLVVVVIVAAGAIGAIKLGGSTSEDISNIPLEKVERGALKISVDVAGTIKALDQEIELSLGGTFLRRHGGSGTPGVRSRVVVVHAAPPVWGSHSRLRSRSEF